MIPPLLREIPDEDPQENDPATELALVELGFGRSFDAPVALERARRALLVGAPGMGKTETLKKLGSELGRRGVIARLPSLGSDSGEDRLGGFLRFLAREARAFDEGTPAPTHEVMREDSLVILLDGLDEVEEAHREGAVRRVLAAVAAWPQHSYIVATRPTIESEALGEASFARFRLRPSRLWGRDFLRERGIPDEQVGALLDRVPTINALLAIPRYASLVADLLIDEAGGAELPATALGLLLAGEERSVALEASRAGVARSELLAWAQRLAVGLELRGRISATIAELAEIPGPPTHGTRAAREWLVRAALLQDLPDEARFTSVVSQEALCADAILRAEDPIAALRRVAVAEIAGEEVFRGDLEHALDLVFEAAPPELRGPLREIDELRWARTQRLDGPSSEVAEAIDVIWHWHRDHRLWLGFTSEGQLRGVGAALRLLTRAHPEILDARRSELVLETQAEEPTTRANAIDLLTLVSADRETAAWLRPRLADENAVVRRHAAHAVEELKLVELLPELWHAWEAETDELGLEAVGRAIISLVDDEELAASTPALRAKPSGWRRLDHVVLPRLNLRTAADLLADGNLSGEEVRSLLRPRLEGSPPESWESDDIHQLARLLVRSGFELYELRGSAEIAEIVARQPDAALAGACEGASEDADLIDVYWLRRLDPARLREAAQGALAGPIQELLERLEFEAQAPLPLQAQEPLLIDPDPPPPSRLHHLLEAGRLAEDQVPQPWMLWEAPALPQADRDRLVWLAETWYPAAAVGAFSRDGQTITVNSGLQGAVVVWTALKLPLERDRWLELLASGIFSLDRRYADWAAECWDDGWSAQAASVVRGLGHPDDVTAAVQAIPRLNAELAEAFAEVSMKECEEEVDAAVLPELRKIGATDLLWRTASGRHDRVARQRVLEELAALGEVAAQREVLEEVLRVVRKTPSAYEDLELAWLQAIRAPELIPLLGEILRAVHGAGEVGTLRRSVEAALQQTGDESALAVYDELISDPSVPGGNFYWHQRNRLARERARQEVLARLPERLAELVRVL